jgi:hypothetical protein
MRLDPSNTKVPSIPGGIVFMELAPRGLPGRSDNSNLQPVIELSVILSPLLGLVDSQDSLGVAVAQLPAEIAAAQAQVAQMNQQGPTTPFAKWVGTFLPLTRTGTDYYPVALTDYENVFLKKNFEWMARHTYDALTTQTPRFTDVRAFLRRELESAYALLPYYEPFVASIQKHVTEREFEALDADYARLAMALPGKLRGDTRDMLTILSWAIAVDGGLLNELVRYHVKNMKNRSRFDWPDPDEMVFYWHDYQSEAPEPQVFQEIIKQYWPILTFAVDPVLDEQNIADAASIHRELQLALAFSFAAGRTSFNQLNRATRRLEYDAETIALNRTISSFTQGQSTFGWRFYPRFQNPPPEASNLHVFANILIRGGQGRNYQMDNSKLEAGQRELTAVVVMPSFVRSVTFSSTGNWFLLHDPEHPVVPTDRMLRQGLKVGIIKDGLKAACDGGNFREEDYEQLAIRIDQVKEMLPMQTQRVNVPFQEVSGFEIFTPISGSQALVPQLLGYDGADYIDPTMETDLILYGKRFSILETQVVAGGKYLARDPLNPETSRMDIIGRDIMRVLLPAGLQPTVKRDGKKYVEVVVSTPNGVSNRFPIPFGPPSSPQATPEPLNVEAGYSLMDDLLKLAANVTPDTSSAPSTGTQAGQVGTTIQTTQTIQVSQGGQSGPGGGQQGNPSGGGQGTQGSASPKLTATPAKVALNTRIRILARSAPARTSQTITADFRFPIPSSPDTVVSVIVEGIPYRNSEGAYVLEDSMLEDVFVKDLITKLNDFGKLTGQNALHDLTTKTILITVDGPDSAPKATTNQLRVNIELYVQKKPAPQSGGASSATAADGVGRSVNATISGAAAGGGATAAPAKTVAPSADESGATTPTGMKGPETEPAGSSPGIATPAEVVASSRSLPRPAFSARRDPVVAQAAQSTGTAIAGITPSRSAPLPGRNGRSIAPGPASPRDATGTAPPRGRTRDDSVDPTSHSTQKPARRSVLSRIMGKD